MLHRTKISLLDQLGKAAGHTNRYGVYLNGELVARVVCISGDPVKWQCENLTGKRLSPTAFWRLAPRPQQQAVREWTMDYFDTLIEARNQAKKG